MSDSSVRIIRRRAAVHFPGFEDLSPQLHRQRFARAAAQSGATWNITIDVSDTEGDAPVAIAASGPNWRTETQLTFLPHEHLVTELNAGPLIARILRGYRAAGATLLEGGYGAYFRSSWRFAHFFLFPFVLMALGLGLMVAVAASPLMVGWPLWALAVSVPLAVALFGWGFLPQAERLHTMHLFADWDMTIKAARMDSPEINALIDGLADRLAAALAQPADEYLITSHSMGGAVALHTLGLLLERSPDLVAGKTITLATLGGPGLQVSLLRSAEVLRRRMRLVLGAPDIVWMDVQCRRDPANFFGARIVRDSGFEGLAEPPVLLIRPRNMLSPERYKRIKWDILRMHRQFVLGSDRRSSFDFQMMVAGPISARRFADFSPADRLPIIGCRLTAPAQ